MPLNLLKHKSWHVWGAATQQRVARDEEQERQRVQQLQQRQRLAESEARWSRLRGDEAGSAAAPPLAAEASDDAGDKRLDDKRNEHCTSRPGPVQKSPFVLAAKAVADRQQRVEGRAPHAEAVVQRAVKHRDKADPLLAMNAFLQQTRCVEQQRRREESPTPPTTSRRKRRRSSIDDAYPSPATGRNDDDDGGGDEGQEREKGTANTCGPDDAANAADSLGPRRRKRRRRRDAASGEEVVSERGDHCDRRNARRHTHHRHHHHHRRRRRTVDAGARDRSETPPSRQIRFHGS